MPCSADWNVSRTGFASPDRAASRKRSSSGIVGAGVLIVLAPLALNWLGPPYSEAVGLVRLAAVAMAAQVALTPIGHLA